MTEQEAAKQKERQEHLHQRLLKKLGDIEFKADFPINDVEKLNYLEYVEKNLSFGHLRNIKEISVALQPGGKNVSIDTTFKPIKFERIRRITGYLVGTTDRWNNAKRAELKDRTPSTLGR